MKIVYMIFNFNVYGFWLLLLLEIILSIREIFNIYLILFDNLIFLMEISGRWFLWSVECCIYVLIVNDIF